MTILPLCITKNTKCIVSFNSVVFDVSAIPEGLYTVYALSHNDTTIQMEVRVRETPSTTAFITRNYPNVQVVNITFKLITLLQPEDYLEIPISISYPDLNKQVDYKVRVTSVSTILPFVNTSEKVSNIDILKQDTSIIIDTHSSDIYNITIYAYKNYKFNKITTATTDGSDRTTVVLTEPLIYKLVMDFGDTIESRYVINYMHCYDKLISYLSKLDVNQIDKIFEMNNYSIIINKFLYLHEIDDKLRTIVETEFTDMIPDLAFVLKELSDYVTTLYTNTSMYNVDDKISTNVIPKFNI